MSSKRVSQVARWAIPVSAISAARGLFGSEFLFLLDCVERLDVRLRDCLGMELGWRSVLLAPPVHERRDLLRHKSDQKDNHSRSQHEDCRDRQASR